MYLTKINKLIWIVFLLPCIQAQINEFIFGLDGDNTYVNVSVSYDVKLICITGSGGMAITTRSDIIIENFKLKDNSGKYSYTYDDTDRNRVIHVLTIKDIKGAIQPYKCVNSEFLYIMHFKSYFLPARPTCKTTQNSDTITLTCRSEKGNPRVSMSIYDSDKTYPTHNELEYVNTHFSRSTFLTEYKENIKCVTTYNFIQNNTVYTTKYICTFNDIARPTIAAITNSTLNVDSQLISSSTHSFGVIKYSIFTLTMAILSRTI